MSQGALKRWRACGAVPATVSSCIRMSENLALRGPQGSRTALRRRHELMLQFSVCRQEPDAVEPASGPCTDSVPAWQVFLVRSSAAVPQQGGRSACSDLHATARPRRTLASSEAMKSKPSTLPVICSLLLCHEFVTGRETGPRLATHEHFLPLLRSPMEPVRSTGRDIFKT